MSQYTTRYKTEHGKTRKLKEPVKEAAPKPADKNRTPGSSGAENKPNQPEAPAKQGGNP